jgi:uncharacterized protein (TIGR02118 family)
MAQLLALYHQPADPAAFDRYYFETHVPLAKKVPGLRSYVRQRRPVNVIAGSPAPHFIAELSFDSMADLQAALSSPEGQAAAGDLSNFRAGRRDAYGFRDEERLSLSWRLTTSQPFCKNDAAL